MDANLLTKAIAEQYLDELLEAEQNHDYQLCCKRWRKDFKEDFPEERFTAEVEDTLSGLGQFKSREYIGCEVCDVSPEKYRKRYVWKTTWDKDECVIVIGIHELEGVVYLNEWMYHWGDENTNILLLNAVPGVSPENEASHSLDITVAEQLLDELIEAEQNCDYAAWSKRWEADIADDYSEQDFLSNLPDTNERLGHHKSREYIGCLSFDGRYGKTYEYAWKSQYEKNVAITTLEIYEKEGVVFIGGNWISWGEDHVYMQLLNHQS